MGYLTTTEIAVRLGISREAVRQLAIKGKFGETARAGRSHKIAESAFDAFIAAKGLCPKGLHPRSKMKQVGKQPVKKCRLCESERNALNYMNRGRRMK